MICLFKPTGVIKTHERSTIMAPAAMAGRILFAVVLCGLIPVTLGGQVSFERLRDAAVEPHNWLTYSGGYFSQRYSELDQITPENVDHLRLQWV